MVKNEEDLNCWTTYDAADRQWRIKSNEAWFTN